MIATLSFAWTFSARTPVVRNSESRWAPLAFSTDGQMIAAADFTAQEMTWFNSMIYPPGGPIHLLRADDLTPVGSPVETPTSTNSEGITYQPPLQIVEFSPKGDLIAVVQRNSDPQQLETMELHLVRIPGGDIWKSLPIPYNRFNSADEIARRLFSSDGHLLAWHEYEPRDNKHFDCVRVWDVVEGRERLAITGVKNPTFSPDGRLLAVVETYNQDGIACRLYDMRNGQLLHSLSLPADGPGWHPWPEFSSDGYYVAVNTQSFRGKGPFVDVFDVASGESVFEAPEWSPHFVSGPVLMTVKDDAVIFRETSKWQVVRRVSFSQGKHWENGSPISPEPQAIPGTSCAFVTEYYPSWSFFLSRICRFFYLDFNLGHSITWIDSKSGSMTKFTGDDGIVVRSVISPMGGKLALQGLWGMTIWKLPPGRTWIPVSAVAFVLASLYTRWELHQWRMTNKNRDGTTDITTNALP